MKTNEVAVLVVAHKELTHLKNANITDVGTGQIMWCAVYVWEFPKQAEDAPELIIPSVAQQLVAKYKSLRYYFPKYCVLRLGSAYFATF